MNVEKLVFVNQHSPCPQLQWCLHALLPDTIFEGNILESLFPLEFTSFCCYFSWSTFPSIWFEFWVQVWLFIVPESNLFSFVNAKSTSYINLGGHGLVWFELMVSIVRMQDSDWWMVVARRGAQESIIAQFWVHCKKIWLITLYSQDFRNRLLPL